MTYDVYLSEVVSMLLVLRVILWGKVSENER